MDSYMIITCDEDGEVRLEQTTKEKLLKSLNNKDYGDLEFLHNIKDNNDPQYWGYKGLIIKGEIVNPKPVATVTQYEVE